MKKYFSGLSISTFLLSLSSLFADISTEMLYPILPIFLTSVLNAPASVVGLIEGVATGIQYSIQGVSGYFSDKFKKRKPIAIFGFSLSAIAKPAIGLAQTWPMVLVGRFFDRLGAGTRSAPRDALVASSADEQNRGKAFGLEGFGDNLGAFLGSASCSRTFIWCPCANPNHFLSHHYPRSFSSDHDSFCQRKKSRYTSKE